MILRNDFFLVFSVSKCLAQTNKYKLAEFENMFQQQVDQPATASAHVQARKREFNVKCSHMVGASGIYVRAGGRSGRNVDLSCGRTHLRSAFLDK